MPYIQAKSDIKDSNGNVIKPGIDLYTHENDVCDAGVSINNVGGYGLDNRIIRWFGIMHDLGKVNPLFQSNMSGKTSAKDVCCRHEISSVLFIDAVPEDIRDIVALLILSHHKSLSIDERGLQEIVSSGFSVRNKSFWNHINGIDSWGKIVIGYLWEHYGIKAEIPTIERCKDILNYYGTKELDYGYSEYRGLCMMADHFASAFEDTTERIINFTYLFKKPDISFHMTKNEKYPLSMIDSDATKKHTFCIAPCGCGKTNFMMKRCSGRVFYMLPYQASINAMAKRLQDDLGKEYRVGIKHASYRTTDIDDTTKDLSNLFGLPVKVMTPFQAISILFRLKGYESLIMDMKGQDVIIDEGHTYYQETPASNGSGMTYGKNMSCVVELIKVLKEIGCRIHVCTATMPTCLKNKIISILGEEDTQIVKLSEEEISSFNRHIIHTKDMFDFNEIIERYKNGEKVLVVHNQINKAIDTFRALRRICGDKIILLHSRFERNERAELEKTLINEFNKSSEPCIVVSTQVIEVSLDINFDVMFTDCADIMSLIQRFGRVNRQRTNIGTYKDVFVINVNDGTGHLPYDAKACKKTFDELKKIDGQVLDENYIQTIIDNVHPNVNEFKFELANPYDENGTWKTQEYCHTVGESVASALEFVGCVVVKESNKDEYIRTRNVGFEIPVSTHNKKWTNGLEQLDNEKVGGKLVYVVPDSWYERGIGLVV